MENSVVGIVMYKLKDNNEDYNMKICLWYNKWSKKAGHVVIM